MSFDAVAFAMGKAGASRDLVSALMGGNGGGGSGTLEESGWVKSLDGGATLKGNTVTLPSGDVSHNMTLAPAGSSFKNGDVVVIAITVSSNYQQLTLNAGSSTYRTMTSATGLFASPSSSSGDYCRSTGDDVLTFTMKRDRSNFSFAPTLNGASGSADAYATISITGIKYNNELIFGKV